MMNLSNKIRIKNLFQIGWLLSALLIFASVFPAQTFDERMRLESARSDKFTGGKIEKTTLAPGEADIKITINVPAFQMTLWQNGREVKTYWVGVGMKDYPIYIGQRRASAVIWNPTWIPPNSSWVSDSKSVKALEVIQPDDPRNPLGKLKIPLGDGFLIHQAKGLGDLGSLVSHGCVRVLKTDLYDLAEKIAAARSLPVTAQQIDAAKVGKKTLTAELDPIVPVEITYDTFVVENGRLNVYPDVYERNINPVEKLRAELESNKIDASKIPDSAFEKMIARAAGKKRFVVSVKSINAGKELSGGQLLPVVLRTAERAPVNTKNTVRRRRA